MVLAYPKCKLYCLTNVMASKPITLSCQCLNGFLVY